LIKRVELPGVKLVDYGSIIILGVKLGCSTIQREFLTDYGSTIKFQGIVNKIGIVGALLIDCSSNPDFGAIGDYRRTPGAPLID
jgi:hypothetical protein